jgi:hypothetical protein
MQVLKPLSHIDGATKQVFHRLRKSSSRDEIGKGTAAGSAGRKIKVCIDELHEPDQRELELQAEAAIGTGAQASGRGKNLEHLTQLSRPSNTGAEALDSPLSEQVLDGLPYPERQAGFKPAQESSKTDPMSEGTRISAGGVTPDSNPDIQVSTHALVAGDDAEEPVGSDGKASMLAGFPRQGQEGAMDEPGLDDSDDEPGMLQQGEPQQEEPQQEASSAAPEEGENASDGACAADAGKEKEALDGKALEKAALAALGMDDSDGSDSNPGMMGGGGVRGGGRG